MNIDKPNRRPNPAAIDDGNRSEAERARVLAQYGLDDLDTDHELQRIVRFAAQLCEVPFATVTVVEKVRQVFLAREGIEQSSTPRDQSFCAHAMLGDEPLVIEDASTHPQFADNPLVTGAQHIRFYTGMPLISSEGVPLGALCVIDTEPRPGGLSAFQLEGLAVMADAVMRRLRSRRQSLARRLDRLTERERLEQLADMMPDLAWTAPWDGQIDFLNQRFAEFIGGTTQDPIAFIHPDDRAQVRETWRRKVAAGEDYEAEFRFRRHDGEYRWMLSRAVPMRNADGSLGRWFGTMTDIDEGHRISEARELLARELSHRIKNIFAVVSGLIALSSRRQPEHRDFAQELTGKIRALGRAHDFVRPMDGQSSAALQGLLRELFAPYDEAGEPRVIVAGDEMNVVPRAATPLALVFHELATNSAKYGALADTDGRVALTIAAKDGEAVMTWREDGASLPDDAPEGFGSQLLRMSVEGQLRGTITREMDAEGLTIRLAVPLSAVSG